MTVAVDEENANPPAEALEVEAVAEAENKAGSEATVDDTAEGDEGEIVVSIGEEAPPQEDTQAAPQWVRELRKRDRENVKRIKELEQRLAEKDKPADVGLPAKPTLEACDYDEAAYERQLTSWFEAKRRHDEREAQQRKAQEDAEAAWSAKVQAYEQAKAKLPVPDVDDAEHAVREIFNETQWAILVDGADNAALLIYALGKNPDKAKELAKIPSLSQFAFKAAKLEADVKTNKRKATPPPETAMTGTAPGSVSGGDATLERLRAEALKTGDMTKVVAYKRQLRTAAMT